MMREILQAAHGVAWVFTTGLWWITFAAVIESGLPAPAWLIPDMILSGILGALGYVWIHLEYSGQPTAKERRMEGKRLGMVRIGENGRVYYQKAGRYER